jgi:hypothetical protein
MIHFWPCCGMLRGVGWTDDGALGLRSVRLTDGRGVPAVGQELAALLVDVLVTASTAAAKHWPWDMTIRSFRRR